MNKYRHGVNSRMFQAYWEGGRDMQTEGKESIKITLVIHYFFTEMLLLIILRADRKAETQATLWTFTYQLIRKTKLGVVFFRYV